MNCDLEVVQMNPKFLDRIQALLFQNLLKLLMNMILNDVKN